VPASKTEAELLVEFFDTLDGTLINDEGAATTDTLAELLLEQLGGVETLAVSFVVPAVPAVNWILSVPAPEVIVPLLIVQV